MRLYLLIKRRIEGRAKRNQCLIWYATLMSWRWPKRFESFCSTKFDFILCYGDSKVELGKEIFKCFVNGIRKFKIKEEKTKWFKPIGERKTLEWNRKQNADKTETGRRYKVKD